MRPSSSCLFRAVHTNQPGQVSILSPAMRKKTRVSMPVLPSKKRPRPERDRGRSQANRDFSGLLGYQLDAAVLGASLGCIVGSHEIRLAIPMRNELVFRNSG